MSGQAHTKEPWHTGGHAETIVYAKDGYAIADAKTFHGKHEAGTAKANAARIVACVNACAGIDNPDDLKAAYAKLQDEHSALLAACKAFRAAYLAGEDAVYANWEDLDSAQELCTETLELCGVRDEDLL